MASAPIVHVQVMSVLGLLARAQDAGIITTDIGKGKLKMKVFLLSSCIFLAPVVAQAQGLPGQQSGHLWLMQSGRTLYAFDLDNPQVHNVLQQAQNGSLPLRTAVTTALGFDPKAPYRCSEAGQSTSMGRAQRGFTVGIDDDCP